MSLTQDEIETLLEWALQFQRPDYEEGVVSSTGIDRHKERYAFRKLAEDTFPIREMRVGSRDIKQALIGIIQDLYIEREGATDDIDPHYPVEENIAEDGLVPTYESKVHCVVKRFGRSEDIITCFYFPMNALLDKSIDKIEIFDIQFVQMSESDWTNKIQKFKKYPDVFNTEFVESLSKNQEFTYWKAELRSKGPRYASEKFKTANNLFCAKLNHCHYLWDTSSPSQWSAVSEPFSVLISINGTPEEVSVVNDEPRPSVNIDWNNPEFSHRYTELPSLEYTAEGTKKAFQNALLEYQRAIVETDKHHAFMAYWRCAEGLSRAGRGEKQEIVDRSKWALKNIKSKGVDEFIDQVANQMYSSRNQWVHEPNWEDIWSSDVWVAKYLSDAMIQIYTKNMIDKELDVIKHIFDMSTMEYPQRKEKYQESINKQEAIEELRQIESKDRL